MKVIGWDPGAINFAYAGAIVRIVRVAHDMKVSRDAMEVIRIKTGELETVNRLDFDMTAPLFGEQVLEVMCEMDSVLGKLFRCDEHGVIAIERMIPRHMVKYNNIEKINLLIGLLLAIVCAKYSHLTLVLPQAATWKRSVDKDELTELYKDAGKVHISRHRIDATFIALYGASYRLNTNTATVFAVRSALNIPNRKEE